MTTLERFILILETLKRDGPKARELCNNSTPEELGRKVLGAMA